MSKPSKELRGESKVLVAFDTANPILGIAGRRRSIEGGIDLDQIEVAGDQVQGIETGFPAWIDDTVPVGVAPARGTNTNHGVAIRFTSSGSGRNIIILFVTEILTKTL